MALDPPSTAFSVIPRRYLRREWKRHKPHLPASDSVPSLHLCPDRPLFICAQCGFSNMLIPMCLWCAWSSAEAKEKFEEKLPRPRRLTAPSRATSQLRSEHTRVKGMPRRVSTDSTNSSGGPVTPEGDLMLSVGDSFQVPGIKVGQELCGTEEDVQKTIVDVFPNSHRVNPLGDGCEMFRGVTTTTSNSSLPLTASSNLRQKHLNGSNEHEAEHRVLTKQSIRHRRRLPPLFLSTASSKQATLHPLDSLHRSSPSMTRDTTFSHSNTSTLLIDAPHAGDYGKIYPGGVSHALSLLSVASASSSQCSPNHKLRRKKRMSLLKGMSSLSFNTGSPESSPSFDDRGGSPVPHATHGPDGTPTPSPRISPLPSPVSSDPPVRIGHPSRPYYTAIRKNMTRPSTAVPRTPSPIPSDCDYAPRATRSLDGGERVPVQFGRNSRPMSMLLPGQAIPANMYSGFSLSGETEMRMNLARWRKEEAPEEPVGYLFKETGRPGKGSLRSSVRKLGKGLRGLMLGRSCS